MAFLQEILEQPEALQDTLSFHKKNDVLKKAAAYVHKNAFKRILFSGMGSSLYACYPAVCWLNQHGFKAALMDASELLYSHPSLLSSDTLFVPVSQSGESPEVKKLLMKVEGRALAVTNEPESALCRKSAVTLLTRAGKEEGVTSKTYICTLAVLSLFALSLSRRLNTRWWNAFLNIPEKMDKMLKNHKTYVDPLLKTFHPKDTVTLLGRGPSLASAWEGALVFKEAAHIHAEGMSAGLFRHGPIELVRTGYKCVVFLTGENKKILKLLLDLARDIQKFGGKVVLVGGGQSQAFQKSFVSVNIEEGNRMLKPLLEILPIQLASYYLGERSGHQPGRLLHGKKVSVKE